jgi:hypothetical protein
MRSSPHGGRTGSARIAEAAVCVPLCGHARNRRRGHSAARYESGAPVVPWRAV